MNNYKLKLRNYTMVRMTSTMDLNSKIETREFVSIELIPLIHLKYLKCDYKE